MRNYAKSLISAMTAICISSGLCCPAMIYADAYDDAANAVSGAETLQTQESVDTAQILISKLDDESQKKPLENRIDKVQEKLDAVLLTDYSENSIGDEIWITGGWNVTAQTDPDDADNTVARQHYTNIGVGGWGPAFKTEAPLCGKLLIESKIRFDSTSANDRYFSMYFRRQSDNEGVRLFDFYAPEHTNKGVYVSYWDSGDRDWSYIQGSNNITPDKWYNVKIIMDTENLTYEAYVVDVKSNVIIASVTGKSLLSGDYSAGIKEFYYRLSGSSSDTNCYLYYDDFKVTTLTPEKTARDDVVKAERSYNISDLENAKKSVENLPECSYKTTLLSRLDTIAAVSAASSAVEKAEISCYQDDKEYAQELVDLLPQGAKKDRLIERLQAIKVKSNEDVAIGLVEAAENTTLQSDIDNAQIFISDTDLNIDKKELFKRIDNIQANADALININYSDAAAGDLVLDWGNYKYYAEKDPDGTENIVASQTCSSSPLGGWGYESGFGASPLKGKIAVEEKFYFDDKPTTVGRSIVLYSSSGSAGSNILTYKIDAPDGNDGGVIIAHGSKDWTALNGCPAIKTNQWYTIKIIYDINDGINTSYNAYLYEGKDTAEEPIAKVENSTIYTSSEQGYSQGINRLQFQLSGASENNAKIYFDDYRVTLETDIIAARNSLVKAERSKLPEDIELAQSYINRITDKSEKVEFQARLNRLQSISLVFEDLTLEKELDNNIYKEISALSSGHIKAGISAVNNSCIEGGTAQMILALYKNENNKKIFTGCKISSEEIIEYGTSKKLCAYIDVPEESIADYELAVFVWDGMNKMKPLYTEKITSKRNPYKLIEAEDFDEKYGALNADNALSQISTGDYTRYNNMVFDGGAGSFEASISGITTNGKIEIRLDSPDGTLIGTLKGLNTASWDNYNNAVCNISNVSGSHDVYLVFTEGVSIDNFKFNINSAPEQPYFGAKFEPEGGLIYSGAGQGDFAAMMAMTNTANQNKKPAIVCTYTWLEGGITEEILNAHINFPGAKMQIATSLMPNDNYKLGLVGEGAYDNAIKKFAHQIKSLPHDIFLRVGYEVDGQWNGMDAEKYIAAHRRVVDIFRQEGVDNVAYLWNLAYPRVNMQYYPGDDYVDWWSYDFWNADDPSHFVQLAAEHKKPVMIGESSKQYEPFSNEFWDNYFGSIKNYPGIKGFQYINWSWNTYGTSDWQWGDSRYTTSEKWIKRYNDEMSEGRYIGLDASYFNTSGLAIQFGHGHAFLNNESTLFNQPWNKNEDIYTTNTGYDYTVINGAYSPFILNGEHTLRPVNDNEELTIIFTVPEGKDGMLYFNDFANHPKDAYIGDRQVLNNSCKSGKFSYYASDVKDGKLTLRLKNKEEGSMIISYVFLQRISDMASASPEHLNAESKNNANILTWNAVDNVKYYNIYRNGKAIAVTTDTEYTDITSEEDAVYSVSSWDEKNGESRLCEQNTL
ncbi:MAG: carbohydrate-binding protein [Clostridia bacterium]|nr:carbohydrate-binding protein [Clostridia bacterium]